MQDVSDQYACLSLQGPNARNALQQVCETDLSAETFTFGTGRFATVAGTQCWLQRLSYVGELGWEIFAPSDAAVGVFTTIQQAGAEYDIVNAGLHALNSLRLEKGFRHWGHDIGAEDNLFEAGLSFSAKPDASNFLGRDAFLAQKRAGLPSRRLVQFLLNDPEPLLYHNESICMGEVVGYLTSGMYAHSLGGAIGMGYVSKPELTAAALESASFEIEVARERFAARASLKPFYDPSGKRMKM